MNTRQPPQVIQLVRPPMEKKWVLSPIRRKLRVWVVVSVGSATVGLATHLLGDVRLATASGAELGVSWLLPVVTIGAGLVYFGMHGALIFEYWSLCRKHTKAGKPPQSPPHLLAEALWPCWQFAWTPPRASDVYRLVKKGAFVDPSRASIVCLRETTIPEAHDKFFEPVVVAPTGGMKNFVIPALVGLPLFIFFFDRMLQIGIPRHLFLLYVGGAVVPLCIWLWLRAIRPRYYRFAPGIVQVIRYPGGLRLRPRIHSYKMDAGTVVVCAGLHSGGRLQSSGIALEVFQDEWHDRVMIHAGEIDQATLDRILEALMSTADIPELSETELAG